MQALTNSIATPAPSTTRKGQLIEPPRTSPQLLPQSLSATFARSMARAMRRSSHSTGSTSTFGAGRSPRSWNVGVGQQHVPEHRGGT